jgi:tetratricopeptide (TPR) repeat protein
VGQLTNIALGKLRHAFEDERRYSKTLTDPKFMESLVPRDALLMMLAYELGDTRAMKEYASLRSELLRKSPANKLYGRDFLAVALAAAGDTDKSAALLEELRPVAEGEQVVNPRVRYYYALGMLHYIRGEYAAAVTAFEKAFALTLPNRIPDYFYSVSLLKSDKRQAAVAELRRLTLRANIANSNWDLDFLPAFYYWPISSIKAHYWLGIACEQQGDKEQAMKEYSTFLDYWKEADFDSKELKDAKARLAKLKAGA